MQIRLRLLRGLGEELEEVTAQPMPVWLRRYYELHSFAFADRPTADRMPVPVRLAAVKELLTHRLSLAFDVLRRMEALGWTVFVEGDRVVAALAGDEATAWERLRRAGVGDQVMLLLDPADRARVPGPAPVPDPSTAPPETAPGPV